MVTDEFGRARLALLLISLKTRELRRIGGCRVLFTVQTCKQAHSSILQRSRAGHASKQRIYRRVYRLHGNISRIDYFYHAEQCGVSCNEIAALEIDYNTLSGILRV